MARIVSNFFISIDLVVESPEKWHVSYFDDEMGAVVGAGFAQTRALLSQGLLDELVLLQHPLVVRAGDRLFGEGESIRLNLTHSEAFGSGVLQLRYVPA